jgi:predicted PP-loop superfamily ATPase
MNRLGNEKKHPLMKAFPQHRPVLEHCASPQHTSISLGTIHRAEDPGNYTIPFKEGFRMEQAQNMEKCVLLFSGGRDSSLAAVALSNRYDLTLLTLTGEHLTGFDATLKRVNELSRLVSPSTRWFITKSSPVQQPALRGCMPCQLSAVKAAMQLARQLTATTLATGYSGYQQGWIEQSPEAQDILRDVLRRQGFTLELPCVALSSKEQARNSLTFENMTPDPLEQRCIIQQRNPGLLEPDRIAALETWARILSEDLPSATFQFRGPYSLEGPGSLDD